VADNIAIAFDLNVLDEELRLSCFSLDEEGTKRSSLSSTILRTMASERALKDVFNACALRAGDGDGRDPVAVGDDADRADRKALSQAVDDRLQCRHVGVLPSHISVQVGAPSPSTIRLKIIRFRSGR
jgi:hypothetical protein